jgi:flagellar M-ring protein FliF
VVSKIVEPRGVVKSVSVAVLVDGTYQKGQGSQKGTFVARNDQEMKKYDDIVKAAIGFDKSRGDQVIVENVPFETAAFEEVGAEKTDYLRFALPYLKYIAMFVVVMLLVIFVIKPLLKTLSAPMTYRMQEGLPRPGMPGPPGVGPMSMPGPVAPEEASKDRALGIVTGNPKQAANVVKEWLQE